MRARKIAIFCAVVALLVVVVVVVRGALKADREISLCWDESHPDYIRDVKAREAACKKL